MHRILLALDPASALAARSALERDGHAVVTTPPESIFDAILRDDFDLVIADLRSTDLSAIAFSRRVDVSGSVAEFLLAVTPSDIASGLIGMNQGAFDFLTLPVDVEHLRLKALRALERRRLRAELSAARALMRERFSPARWLDLPTSARLRSDVEAILPGRAPVLLVGEPGTETAALAHLIHLWGHRASGPFVPVPGSIFPARELETALRGVARSESSGHRRPGWFERAHGGTLFFEEIARIPLEIQEWLVSVIDGGPIQPLGAAAGISADVRILFAIHQSPDVAAANQRLAPALFERLRRNAILVPPLRDRREEIPGLVQEVLDACGLVNLAVTSSALHWLEDQRWPGNRMEIEGTLLRALLDRRSPDRLSLADLVLGAEDASEPVNLRRHPEPESARSETAPRVLEGINESEGSGDLEESGTEGTFEDSGSFDEPNAFANHDPLENEERAASRGPDSVDTRDDHDRFSTSDHRRENQDAPARDMSPHPQRSIPSFAPSNGANGRSWTEAVERARSMHDAERSNVETFERATHAVQSRHDSAEEQEHGSLHLPEHGVDLVLLERQLIEEALDRTGGNQTHAARLLGLTRQTLIYRMQKYGIR